MTSLPVLEKSFVELFNLVLHSGVYPRSWCSGYIVPILKSGDKSDPSNYRGITISSCIGKFFSIILNTRLTSFLESKSVLNPAQIGFMKGSRTSDHVFALKMIIYSYTKQKENQCLLVLSIFGKLSTLFGAVECS